MHVKTARPGADAHDIAYIMGWDRTVDSREPLVLYGDPVDLQQAGLSCIYATPHWAGMLCFEEHESPADATAAFDLFSSAVLPGARTGQFQKLAVLHREPGRVTGSYRSAVHFAFSHVDLLNDRRVQPYWKTDHRRIELFQELLNLSWGLSSPKDPSRARSVTAATHPRTPVRLQKAQDFAVAVANHCGSTQVDASKIADVVRAHGAYTVETNTTRSGRLGLRFNCAAPDEGTMEVRLVIDPERVQRQLARSQIKDLVGECFERTPAMFERLRDAFLIELEKARARIERRHGYSELAYSEIVHWARGATLAPPNVEAAPMAMIANEADFGIKPLPNPMAGFDAVGSPSV